MIKNDSTINSQDFYNLKQLSQLKPIVNLSYRQLLKRVKTISNEYDSDKIFKKSNVWFIHKSLVSKFKKVKYPMNYKLFVTIASKERFEYKYWSTFINIIYKELKMVDKTIRVRYVIEHTDRELPHLHFMTTYDDSTSLRKMFKDILVANVVIP